MNTSFLFRSAAIGIWMLAATVSFCGDVSSPGFAGHWTGVVGLPNSPLAIRIDVSREADEAAWHGTIDLPSQGLAAFALSAVKSDGANVSFAMAGIPGEPQFSGRLSPDGETVSGDFTQSGQTFSFKLERVANTKPKPVLDSAAAKHLVGSWSGTLKPAPSVALRLLLEVRAAVPDISPEAVLVSLDQGNARIPVTAIEERDGRLHFEFVMVHATFDGKLSDDGAELTGEWKQGSAAIPLLFRRTPEKPQVNRPQEPRRPYAYAEQEILIQTSVAGVTLAGTVTIPTGAGPHPAVVLVAGSGPMDRDEAVFGHRPFLVLADHLTRNGIAVLRYDKRGVAKSTGSFGNVVQADLDSDALSAVNYLRTRKEIDRTRVGLVGHSEGGAISRRLASRSPVVAFIVLLAAPGLPMGETMLRQTGDSARAMGIENKTVERLVTLYREIQRIIQSEHSAAVAESAIRQRLTAVMGLLSETQRTRIESMGMTLDVQLQLCQSAWFRDVLANDKQPLPIVTCPVLALNGDRDIQVSARENLAAIRAQLAQANNKNVETVELPGLNHLFQHCRTGLGDEYSEIEETFDPAALQTIASWIRRVALMQS